MYDEDEYVPSVPFMDRETPFVVKIQKPLAGDMSDALIYDESRQIQTFVPFTADIAELFKEGELKVYHWAFLSEDGILKIEQRATSDVVNLDW